MRHHRWWIPALGLLLAACGPGQPVNIPAWSLLPQPAGLAPAVTGAVTVASGDSVWLQAPPGSKADATLKMFLARAQTLRGLQLVRARSADSARIVFKLDPASPIKSNAGYRIHVGKQRITAIARTPRGLFYASITVGQLLSPDAARGTVRVADGEIADHPRFAWRGFMLDSSRHFQSVEEIKQLLDWMALHKLDVFHWHLTDDQGWRLQIKRYPELTAAGSCRKAVGPDAALTGGPGQPYCGYYTQDQAREIVRYAARRFITVVPEIDIPGHAQAALHAYPLLGVTGQRPPVSTDWGINDWLFAPDETSIQFLENVLDEVMDIFPSRYIHVGGDEAAKSQWEASPKTVARMKKLGLKDMNALQGWMIGRIGTYLDRHGRTLVGWDEILDGGTLPDSAVVMSWRGVDGAVTAAEKGRDTILSPSPELYLDRVQSSAHDEPPARPDVRSLKDIYAFQPLPARLSATQAHHVLGLQANLWTEYMPTFARDQHAVFPRMAAWAEVAWSPATAIDWKGFLARMPAELARYRKLGIAYADSAWAPRFHLRQVDDRLQLTLSSQTGQGRFHYTLDGSTPDRQSPRYQSPLSLPLDQATTVRVATYGPLGQAIAAPRERILDAQSLRTRNSDQLTTCDAPGGIILRLEDDRPLDGPRPVYKVDIGNPCWIWKQARLDGVTGLRLEVGNLPWNYALLPRGWKAVVARPDRDVAGHFEVHLDRCTGPLLARMPLDKAARSDLQTTLESAIPAVQGRHDLCLFATGDPRKGRLWALDIVQLRMAAKAEASTP